MASPAPIPFPTACCCGPVAPSTPAWPGRGRLVGRPSPTRRRRRPGHGRGVGGGRLHRPRRRAGPRSGDHVLVRVLRPATAFAGRAHPDRPGAGRSAERLRVGLTSCAYWSCGFFNAYANLAARDLDLVVHVGDYIYENDFAAGAGRPCGPTSLRARWSRSPATAPGTPSTGPTPTCRPCTPPPDRRRWDDHEIVGGAWRDGAAAHLPACHGPWDERRAAAVQAYFEWMPVRRPGPESVYRTLSLGPLADLVMLDTRLVGRDRPATDARRPVLGRSIPAASAARRRAVAVARRRRRRHRPPGGCWSATR